MRRTEPRSNVSMMVIRPPATRAWRGIVGIGCLTRAFLIAKRIAWHSQQSAAERELLGAMAVGEQAVVANAMEAARQHVERESAHALARVEAHVRHMGNGSVELYHPPMILAEADQSARVTSHSDE